MRQINYRDLEFLRSVSHELDRYFEASPAKVEFRCPYCGDSKTDKTRRRGAILCSKDTNESFFNCKNCGTARPFWGFLLDNFPKAHADYSMSKFRETDTDSVAEDLGARGRDSWRKLFEQPTVEASATPVVKRSQKGTVSIKDLPSSHPARVYMNSRGLTRENLGDFYNDLRWTDDFVEWNNEHGRSPIKSTKIEGRILIPLTWRDGTELGVQARAVSPVAKAKYVSTMYEDSPLVCFGADRIDMTKDIWIVEGCFDAVAIGNAMASLTSDLAGLVERLIDVDPSFRPEQFILLHDNEVGNPDVSRRLQVSCESGMRVGFWTESSRVIGKDAAEAKFEKKINPLEYVEVHSGLSASLQRTIQRSRW